MGKRMVGIVPHSFSTEPDYDLIREAGIEWLRLMFRFPWRDKVGGEYTDEFVEALSQAESLHKQGFRFLGTTTLPQYRRWVPEEQLTRWVRGVPEWAEPIDDDRYYDVYEAACEEVAKKTAGMVEYYQISNEPDNKQFTGWLSDDQIVRFLLAGARGVHAGNPQGQTGINLATLDDRGRWLLKAIYAIGDSPFDFVGLDGYFGSWHVGGPERWPQTIDEAVAITGKPVIIPEWGYASIGTPTDDFCNEQDPAYNQLTCQNRAFANVWHGEHSPEIQAAYIRECLRIFATHPNVLGSFMFKWGDDEFCWQCGQRACPAECRWGFVDTEGKPKPAYWAFKQAVADFY